MFTVMMAVHNKRQIATVKREHATDAGTLMTARITATIFSDHIVIHIMENV